MGSIISTLLYTFQALAFDSLHLEFSPRQKIIVSAMNFGIVCTLNNVVCLVGCSMKGWSTQQMFETA